MKTYQINISFNFKVNIYIFEYCVIIETINQNFKRSTSFESIKDAIENTTINPVRNFLISL